MADNFTVPSVGRVTARRADVACAPPREPLFRSLWTAAVVSYTGTSRQTEGAGWSFLLNALSFLGVVLFLYTWKRAPQEPLPKIHLGSAILEGVRYVRGAPQVMSVLIRTGAFSIGASSLLALLPVICQPHGAQGYGFLLTCFGLGALAGAAVLPRLRLQYSVDGLVAGATVVFAMLTFAAGQIHIFEWLC